MPATTPEPPLEVVDSARAAWRRRGWLKRWLPGPRKLLMPHKVFVVELRALAEPEAIEQIARPVGWRFLWGLDSKAPVAIEVSDKGHAVEIERGPFVEGAARVFRMEAHDPRLSETTFEPRILRIPEAPLTAVWYAAPESDAEVFVPLPPAPDQFEPFQAYEAPQFLEIASALARRKLQQYASSEDSEEIGSS